MSGNRDIYIGHYLRVWMPKEKRVSTIGSCPKCGHRSASKFCGNCGGQLVFGFNEYLPSIHEYCEKVFGDEERFAEPYIDDDLDYTIVLENSPDMLGCLWLGDYKTEQELPNKNERGDDWQVLMDALTKDGIKYEQRFGIVHYYS